jgi:hypothetical protein
VIAALPQALKAVSMTGGRYFSQVFSQQKTCPYRKYHPALK